MDDLDANDFFDPCPKGDPDCMGFEDECHDGCQSERERRIMKIESVLDDYDSEPDEDTLVNLLADIRHFCDDRDYSFATINIKAHQRYEEAKRA